MKTNGIKAVQRFVLGFICMLFVFGGITYFLDAETIDMNKGMIYIFFALQQILTLGILRFAVHKGGRKGGNKIKEYFEQRAQRKGRGMFWKRVIGGFLFYMIFSGLLYSLIEYFELSIPGFYGEQGVQTMLQDMNITGTMDRLITILMIVIVGPIVEEMVYRGLITDALMQKRRWGGVVLAAAIFALIHMEPHVMGNLFILALILGLIYYKTGSMIYTFLFHVIINGMGVVALWAQENGLLESISQ